MVQMGLAHPSSSPWSSPLHMVHKSDDNWHPCGDYRVLNARTIPDRYPIRHIEDFTHALWGKQVFSKIDLVWVYNQIPVTEDGIPKTAIIHLSIYSDSHTLILAYALLYGRFNVS